MKQTNATLALSALLLLSLTSIEAKMTRLAGVRRMTKDTAHKTRNLAGTQIKTAIGAVAQGIDKLLYPAVFFAIGKHVYANLPEGVLPDTPPVVVNAVGMVPHGQQASDMIVRLVTGCVAVAATHAVLTTETMGNFIDTNMPHLSRLLDHVGTENGLKSRKDRKKESAL